MEPDPLVPADCDLRDFQFMPLYLSRLFNSELWLLGSAEEKVAAIQLWGKAWHQVPAASLPDDDRYLAALSGAGPKWKKIRAMALHGFVKCSDGRLYHSVLAELALDAWGGKWERPDKKQHRSEHARKAAQARWAAHAEASDEHMPEHARALPGHCSVHMPNDALKGKGEGEGRDIGPGMPSALPDLTLAAPPLAKKPAESKRPASKTAIPDDFGISERVRRWAAENGHQRLGEHLDSFKRKVAARGYRYVDWDAAFMEAIREDWAKLGSLPAPHGAKSDWLTGGI